MRERCFEWLAESQRCAAARESNCGTKFQLHCYIEGSSNSGKIVKASPQAAIIKHKSLLTAAPGCLLRATGSITGSTPGAGDVLLLLGHESIVACLPHVTKSCG